MTKVVLADSQVLMRAGLRTLLELEGRFLVVAEVGDKHSALREITRYEADVLLIEVGLNTMSFLDLLVAIKLARLDTKVVLLSANGTRRAADLAFAAGADGYVLKSDTPRELFAAIRAVSGGARHVSARVSGNTSGTTH